MSRSSQLQCQHTALYSECGSERQQHFGEEKASDGTTSVPIVQKDGKMCAQLHRCISYAGVRNCCSNLSLSRCNLPYEASVQLCHSNQVLQEAPHQMFNSYE